MFCKHCGRKLNDDVRFCSHCGACVKEEPKNKTFQKILPWLVIAVITLTAVFLLISKATNHDNQPAAPEVQTQSNPAAIEIISEETIPSVSSEMVDAWRKNVISNDPFIRIPFVNESNILSATFLDTIKDAPAESADVSHTSEGKVLAWAEKNGNYYDVYFAADGGINAKDHAKFFFMNCENMVRVEFNNCFHTEESTTMASMFSGCKNLTELDLSGLDTSHVENMGEMFSNCSSLTQLDLNSFDTSNVTNMTAMFSRCPQLTNLDLWSWDVSNVKTYAVFMDQNDTINGRPWEEFFESQKTEEIYNSPFAHLESGDVLTFGSYEQDNDDSNGKEPIEWMVLDKQDDALLVISKYGLSSQPYHGKDVGIAWENSYARYWLNVDFCKDAFAAEEQKLIKPMVVLAHKNPRFDTDTGEGTIDLLFLLSIDEVKQYFDGNGERVCQATPFAVRGGAYVRAETKGSWWLLRTPGESSKTVASVNSDGTIDYDGGKVTSERGVFRPAMWIDLKAGG